MSRPNSRSPHETSAEADSSVPCAACKAVPAHEGFPTTNGTYCQECADKLTLALDAMRQVPQKLVPSTLTGLLGGLLGSFTWVGLVALMKAEWTFFPFVLGGFVAVGVNLGAGKTRGRALQVLAALILLAAFVGARFLVAVYVTSLHSDPSGMQVGSLYAAVYAAMLEEPLEFFTRSDFFWALAGLTVAVGWVAPTKVRFVLKPDDGWASPPLR